MASYETTQSPVMMGWVGPQNQEIICGYGEHTETAIDILMRDYYDLYLVKWEAPNTPRHLLYDKGWISVHGPPPLEIFVINIVTNLKARETLRCYLERLPSDWPVNIGMVPSPKIPIDYEHTVRGWLEFISTLRGERHGEEVREGGRTS